MPLPADPLLSNPHVDPATLSAAELASLADTYAGLKARKTELNREIDRLDRDISRAKHLLTTALQQQGLHVIGGNFASVTLKYKTVPKSTSWPDIYAYIIANNAFDLLHRRLGEEGVRLRWAAGETIPGIEPIDVADLSVSTVR